VLDPLWLSRLDSLKFKNGKLEKYFKIRNGNIRPEKWARKWKGISRC
jgi:hypothetical protein